MTDEENVPVPEMLVPTRAEAILFRAKTVILQGRHSLFSPPCRRFKKSRVPGATTIAESRTPLYSSDHDSELELQSGKIQNLRIASTFLDRITVPKGETFSFWAHLPRPVRRLGFVAGRELREGCIVPSIGGGLCQLSNALYDCALKAGLKIVERHAHSRIIPGSLAAIGRDATVFWNYVDLKFRADFNWRIRIFLTRNDLVVRIETDEPLKGSEENPGIPIAASKPVQSCETCGVDACFRHSRKPTGSPKEFTVWAVDTFTPEFGEFVAVNHSKEDWLLTPLSSKRKFASTRYPWPTTGFAEIVDFPGFVIHRSIRSRRLAHQGAERQLAALHFNRLLAEKMIRCLPHQAGHIVVSLELLPFFWDLGVLGGRRFDVMMTRWPIRCLEETLNRAAQRWPESPTLSDFRASETLRDTEWEALQSAESWISPHPEILRHAPDGKAHPLDWKLPSLESSSTTGKNLVFPATTVGRNGAWEIREAVRRLGTPLKILGPILESPTFWQNCDVASTDSASWMTMAKVVVMPTWISQRPSRLLEAIGAGIPVITTKEAGISHLRDVTTVATGDVEALECAIRALWH